MSNKINTRPPVEKGFMKGGLFKWPLNTFKCVGCGAMFDVDGGSGKALRCPDCREKRRKEYFKRYVRKPRKSL